MRFKDKVAIVTGGGSGIGEAAAKLFAREGASVTVADWNGEGAERVAAEINAEGGKAIAIKVDVSNADQVETLVDQTLDAFGTIHILVNNAGINPVSPFIVATEDELDRVLGVNIKGIFLCSKAVVPIMIDNMYGKIINVTSIMSIIAGFGQSAYNASKGGAKLLTQGMAIDLAEYGINVNAVAPGMVKTGLTRGISADATRRAWFEEKIPMKRMGEPDDIALPILFLASDDARYIHGETLVVDGGMIATR